MERTKYFNYTKPGQTQLNYTEDSRARSILKRQRSTSQMGIRTGFRVSINVADATKIDIGPGEGYTGGFFANKNLRSTNAGEIVSTLTDTITGSGYIPTKVGQALASYASGTKNYVSLVYAETESQKLAENRTPYVEHDTIVAETYTVEVLTETNWLLLTNDDLENRILVAIVTAKGIGIALTLSDIVQLTQPSTHPVASVPITITGVIIEQVSNDTVIGTATLRWDLALNTLYWTAPGDTEGTGTAVSSSGVYYLYSSNTSYYIKINLIYAGLPAVSTTEDVEITSLYGRSIPLYSAIDQAHRDMVGTGNRSATNPHALDINDITGGTFEHADLFHVCGISSHAQDSQLVCTVDNNSIDITNLGSTDNSFLIDGTTYDLINGVAAGTDATIDFSPAGGPFTDGEYIVYLDGNADPQYAMTSDQRFDNGGVFTGYIYLADIRSSGNGQCTLAWDDSAKTLTFTGVDGIAGTPVLWEQSTTATYYKLYSNNTDNWIIIYVYGNLNTPAADLSLTFNTYFGEDNAPLQGILKLCMTSWDETAENHTHTPIDLRRFNTADNRTVLEEEHDENGYHTKVIQNYFRVAVASGNAANFSAVSGTAIMATGLAKGANVIAGATDYNAAVVGVNVTANNNNDNNACAVYGSAINSKAGKESCAIGVMGRVDGVSATGVCGIGVSGTGIYGAGSYGIWGIASVAWAAGYVIGGFFHADNLDAGSDNSAVGVEAYGVGVAATGAYCHALGVGGTGLYGEGGTAGYFAGGTVDIACAHGQLVPAFAFANARNGAPGGALVSNIYIKIGANTFCMPIYATA